MREIEYRPVARELRYHYAAVVEERNAQMKVLQELNDAVVCELARRSMRNDIAMFARCVKNPWPIHMRKEPGERERERRREWEREADLNRRRFLFLGLRLIQLMYYYEMYAWVCILISGVASAFLPLITVEMVDHTQWQLLVYIRRVVFRR